VGTTMKGTRTLIKGRWGIQSLRTIFTIFLYRLDLLQLMKVVKVQTPLRAASII
jgi:hypothetical protein